MFSPLLASARPAATGTEPRQLSHPQHGNLLHTPEQSSRLVLEQATGADSRPESRESEPRGDEMDIATSTVTLETNRWKGKVSLVTVANQVH